MKPNRLSAQVFYELPPVLAHYLEQERNTWLEGMPRQGRLLFRDKQGAFASQDQMQVERLLLFQFLGGERAAAYLYRLGFEQGRREAQQHLDEFNQNVRLALQAGPVLGQVQGRFVAEDAHFEFDLDERTLRREQVMKRTAESEIHKALTLDPHWCGCWHTAGYFAGHVSEIVGRRVLTLETECIAKGAKQCRFLSRLDPEWGQDGAWARKALSLETIADELGRADAAAAAAKKAEHSARVALNELNRRLRSDLMLDGLVGESAEMTRALARARQVMESDVPVLLVGEAGTGRETLARAVHCGGARRSKPFVCLDCLGLTDHLLTQELLGYVRDGIPGATQPHTGAYQRAHGGTVYLNEIANLTLEAQVWLFRAMREGVLYPIGGDEPIRADVRVIAATQYDLRERIASGRFLEHLYYALGVAVDLPPLRERGMDILRLAELFLREFADKYDRPELRMAREFQDILLHGAWPGNVRQLRHVLEHAVITASKPELDAADLPDEIVADRCHRMETELTREIIEAALRRTRANRTQAAQLLGVGRTTLWRAMKQFGLLND